MHACIFEQVTDRCIFHIRCMSNHYVLATCVNDFHEVLSLVSLVKQGMMYGDMLESFQMPKEVCSMIGLSGR